MVVDTLLPAERRRMAALVPEGPGDVAEAVGEVAVAFAVYRSYLPDGAEQLDRAASHGGDPSPGPGPHPGRPESAAP